MLPPMLAISYSESTPCRIILTPNHKPPAWKSNNASTSENFKLPAVANSYNDTIICLKHVICGHCVGLDIEPIPASVVVLFFEMFICWSAMFLVPERNFSYIQTSLTNGYTNIFKWSIFGRAKGG